MATMQSFRAPDGTPLTYREVGEGRPLILLHGLFGDGTVFLPLAEQLEGRRVILPDLRRRGPYPPDVLADDMLALVRHLELTDYDLGGYSLGGRIVVRMLVRGATPRRAIVAGQGLRQILGLGGGVGDRLRSPDERTEQWLRTSGQDAAAWLSLIDSVVATPREDLRRIQVPTLVVVGEDDERAASAEDLARVLHAEFRKTPGNHATAMHHLLPAITGFG